MESRIIAIGRRARERAIAHGDAEGVERAERWLFRGIAEQHHYDAAKLAEIEQGLALGELVEIWRRDNDH